MKEKKLVPKLRFPGFTEPWEQRKFGELFLERREKTTEENEDILLSCAITGIYLNSDLFSHFRGSSTVGYLKVRKNDLILSAQNLHLGNANINFNFEHGMISPAYKVFEIESCDPYFVNAWVKKESTKIFFLKATTEGASQCRKNIDWDALINQELLTPNALEQETIGKFFNQLDRYITLHQRKLEHLKLKKKSLLQKLFPKEGEVYPELRFSGFTDPWEQRKGDEVFISVSDKGYPQLPVLSASQELGMVYRDENGIDIHHNKSNEDTYKRVLPGQFVIHLRSFQGGFAYSNVEGITSPAYTVITFKNPELHYGLFWKQVFKSLTFIKHLETITYGIRDGRSISFSDFRSLKLCYPTYGEQKFIGDGLEKTDNLITLHQRKLEHLQLLKKALLQQLFV